MDPVPLAPPEVIVNYGEEPDRSQSGSVPFYHFPPNYHQPFSAELNTHELPERSLQTSHEITGREARTDESPSQRAVTVAEMLRRAANSHHRASWTPVASNPTPMCPVQHQESPSFLNVLPCVSPSPLSLQEFSPDATQMGLTPLFPELIFTPCTPQDTCWLNMSPLTSTPDSRCGFSPFVLVPISTPTEFWFSPYSPARPWLPQPEFHPRWCMCPQSVPVHQPCSPGLLSSRAESAASGREQSEEQSKSEGQRSKICREEEKEHKEETPVEENLQADNGGNNTIKSETSPTFLDPLDDELLAKLAFEDYMLIMDTLSPEIQENVDAEAHENDEERDGEEERLEIANGSFLEYLDELCMDEEFVRKVGLTLDTEYLDSLLSSNLVPIDLLALEEREQVTLQEQSHQPAVISNSDPVTDGTSLVASTPNKEEEHIDSFLSSDPEPIDFIPLREQEQETLEVGQQEESLPPALCCSPLLPSHLLEETPESQVDESFPLPEEYCSPLLHHNGSLFMDCSFTSSLQSLVNASLDISFTSDLMTTLPPGDVGQDESEDVSVSLKNLTDNQSAQSPQKLQDGSLPEDFAFKSPSSCSVCHESESQGTKIINLEQSGETADKEQDQELAGEQCEADSSDICSEIGEQNELLTKTQPNKMVKKKVKRKEEWVQMSSIVRRKTRSTSTAEEVQLSPVLSPATRARQRNKIKSSPKRGTQNDAKLEEVNVQENATEHQTPPVSSPKKRHRSRRDEEEKSERANDANETDSIGCEAAEDKASSSLLSLRVQTDTHSTQDSKDDRGRLEESAGETLLNESNESLSAKTGEEIKQTQKQTKTVNDSEVMGNKSCDFYRLRSTTHNTRQVRKKSEKPDLLNRRGIQEDEATQATRHLFGLRNRRPDKTADVKGDREKTNEEERPSFTPSPVKRHRQDKVEVETEMHRLSPIKRTRKKKTEVKFERVDEQTGDENPDEAETSGCLRRPASERLRGKTKAEPAGQETSEAKRDAGKRPSRDKSNVAETRTDRFSGRRRTRLSEKLPTKYKDFISYKPKRTRQTSAGQAEKKARKKKKR